MHNRTVTTSPTGISDDNSAVSTKYVVLQQITGALRSFLEWLRGGYPDEAPRTGHSTLLALCGPLALTPSQMDCVANDLETQSTATDIDVAITKVTGKLPTPTQTRAVALALHHRVR